MDFRRHMFGAKTSTEVPTQQRVPGLCREDRARIEAARSEQLVREILQHRDRNAAARTAANVAFDKAQSEGQSRTASLERADVAYADARAAWKLSLI